MPLFRAPPQKSDRVRFWVNNIWVLMMGRMMKPRSAIKKDLFAVVSLVPKSDRLGDLLGKISQVVDFVALASEVDRVAP